MSKIARMKTQSGLVSHPNEYAPVATEFNEVFGGSHNSISWHWLLPLDVKFPEWAIDNIMGYEWDPLVFVCSGCVHAFRSRVTKKEHDVCPFCRTPPPKSYEEIIKRFEKRLNMDLNDTDAIYNMGCYYARGQLGLPQNQAKALELWHRAGELGHATAYYSIGGAYMNGRGVEIDKKKATHYYELAAMGGNPYARHNLGNNEWRLGNIDRALKHFMIAVKDGHSDSMKNIKHLYKHGFATKDEYAKALRAYQVYLDEVKSDQRDEAAAENDSIYC